MQPSQAPNETRLPRAVVQRMQRINDKLNPPAPTSEPGTPNPAEVVALAETPVATAATPAEPKAPDADPRKNDPHYWEQRFRVTQGILDAERQRHAGKVDNLNQQMTELRGELTTLRTNAPAAPVDLGKYFTPEQIEQFGEEQCATVVRAAETASRSIMQTEIDARVAPLIQKQEQREADTAADRSNQFLAKLTEFHPNWQAENADDRWIAWLLEKDESTDLQRQLILDKHQADGNAAGIARMFKDWKKTIASAAPPPAPPVAPSGSAAAASADTPPPSPEQVAGLTAPNDAEVKAFYKRSALGQVKDEERVKFEARLKLRNAGR